MLLKHFWNSLYFKLVDMVILNKTPHALFMINFLAPSPLTSAFNPSNSGITHQFKVPSKVTFYCKIKKKNGGCSLGERTNLWPLDLKVESNCTYFFY